MDWKFRRQILKQNDLSQTELTKLAKLLHEKKGLPEVALRFRALILLAQNFSAEDVHKRLGICVRQIFRWKLWYSEGGVVGLLRDYEGAFKQCNNCQRLKELECFSTGTTGGKRYRMSACRSCDAKRKAQWRQMPAGKSYTQKWSRCRARYRSTKRYRSTPKGQEARRRESIARAIAEMTASL